MSASDPRWHDACLAARLFAVDPQGLRGVALRAGPGPVRDAWTQYLRSLFAAGTPQKRMPANIEDDSLLGGVDLPATLQAGRPVVQKGLLAGCDGGILWIAMAERLGSGTAARIASALDRHETVIERDGISRTLRAAIGVVAFDEGASPDEQLPACLAERLAFHIDLSELGMRGISIGGDDAAIVAQARTRLARVVPASDAIIEALVATASSFAIGSIVAPLLALQVSRASAALSGRSEITHEDALLAARLVLAPRARSFPPEQDSEQDDHADEPEETEPPEEHDSAEHTSQQEQDAPPIEDLMRAAVQAALPPSLLETLKCGASTRTIPVRRSGSGHAQSSPKRGRPAGTRMGALRSGSRLALVATLRAAAPWQAVRRADSARTKRIEVRRDDFRIQKFVQRRESTVVFCVDASGSSAFHRLAEAKGAVELLLADAYVERTHAALVAFRGTEAEILLPPSRSLTRARALLSTLPGGGGTPLAAGLEAATGIALSERVKGRDPLIVVLTDGRANIARDGRAMRPLAFDDAIAAARQLAAERIPCVLIDTSPRAREEGARLAVAMGARYVPLPYVEAASVRDAVRASVP